MFGCLWLTFHIPISPFNRDSTRSSYQTVPDCTRLYWVCQAVKHCRKLCEAVDTQATHGPHGHVSVHAVQDIHSFLEDGARPEM